MKITDAIHELEQDIIQFKASQNIGSSNSRILKIADIKSSGSWSLNKYIIGVFTSKTAIHPLIIPRVTCKIDNSDTHDHYINGNLQNSGVELSHDQTLILASLWSSGSISSNILDEYTTAFIITFYPPDYNNHTYSVEGTLYATCEGELKIYALDP